MGTLSEPTGHLQISLLPILQGTALHAEGVGKNWREDDPQKRLVPDARLKLSLASVFAFAFPETSVWKSSSHICKHSSP